MGNRLVVLGWHNIEPTWSFHGDSPTAARQAFRRQVQFLRRFVNVVPLRSALSDLTTGRPLPARAVALTFDDGYLDNVTYAAPLLEAEGLPATFFLLPQFLSGDVTAWWEDLGWSFGNATVPNLDWAAMRFDLSTATARRSALGHVTERLKLLDRRSRQESVAELREKLMPGVRSPGPQRQFMNWDEATLLLAHGHEIGSHTCTHPILSREDPKEQAAELVESRRTLAERFGCSIDVLAFPNGRARDYSADTLRLVHQAGYQFAVTTQPEVASRNTHPHEVPRFLLSPKTDPGSVLRGITRLARRKLGRG